MKKISTYSFTLLELLLVVSVISILMSLLLPTMKKVREAAVGINCQNNMKQMGAAFIMYGGDYNGWALPYHSPNATDPWLWYWPSRFYPYILNRDLGKHEHRLCDVMNCPIDKEKRVWAGHPVTNYSYNNHIGYTWTNGLPVYPMRKLSRCAKPSHALLLIDGKSSLSFGFYGVDYVFQFSDFRHAGQCNELFADGHVENSKLSDAQQMYLDGTFKNDDSSEFWPE